MSEFIATIGESKHKIKVFSDNKVELNGKLYDVEYSKVNDHLYLIKVNDKIFEVTTTKRNNEKYNFLIDGYSIESTVRTTLQEKANEFLSKKALLSHHDDVKAPMPGLILKINKKAGEVVKLGEPLIVLEAMKMENEIRSPASGTIKEIFYKEGEPVEKDSVILKIE